MFLKTLSCYALPLTLCALFIGEGVFSGRVFSGSRHVARGPVQTQLLSAPSSPSAWPLAHLVWDVQKALPAGSALASALRMESFPLLQRQATAFIAGKHAAARPDLPPQASQILQHPLFLALMNPEEIAESGYAHFEEEDETAERTGQPLRWNHVHRQCELAPGVPFKLENRLASAPQPPVRSHAVLTMQQRAAKYSQAVEVWSRRFQLKPDLVYAIIYTESSFNPNLISSRAAHGLMQVVPDTAGGEVKLWLGEKGRPTPSELLDPYTNIKYGTGYFRLLLERHFGPIRDALSREYCAIAAYNSGSAPILRVFGRNRHAAFEVINTMNADEVLNNLLDRVPLRETRAFIRKVLNARQHFLALSTVPGGRGTAMRTVARN